MLHGIRPLARHVPLPWALEAEYCTPFPAPSTFCRVRKSRFWTDRRHMLRKENYHGYYTPMSIDRQFIGLDKDIGRKFSHESDFSQENRLTSKPNIASTYKGSTHKTASSLKEHCSLITGLLIAFNKQNMANGNFVCNRLIRQSLSSSTLHLSFYICQNTVQHPIWQMRKWRNYSQGIT